MAPRSAPTAREQGASPSLPAPTPGGCDGPWRVRRAVSKDTGAGLAQGAGRGGLEGLQACGDPGRHRRASPWTSASTSIAAGGIAPGPGRRCFSRSGTWAGRRTAPTSPDDLLARGLKAPELLIGAGGKGLEAARQPVVGYRGSAVRAQAATGWPMLARTTRAVSTQTPRTPRSAQETPPAKSAQVPGRGDSRKKPDLFTFLRYPPTQWRSLRRP